VLDEQVATLYNPHWDRWERGRAKLMLRVDEFQRLPKGVEVARLRADGKRVVIAWAMDDPNPEIIPPHV
jgi:hypothetical protein